ncbi:MAG: acyl transferase [Cytophagales bacterium CG12_big_fil_rev_8_21_14_0_65_40_12]|nr:MAG: acyl transferase [Cytophagales bacterium CG12_big_fil_rev_8_21_14_0_65_40_12]PIW03669.1 MAG: acyl transferase [Cytophagales bacterium CG17_big_fil_post_rev_8_21_14_2_50_40_13]
MDVVKSLCERIFSVDEASFAPLALDIFHFQYANNALYKAYVNGLGRKPAEVRRLEQIPFLPIEFFKGHTIKSGNWNSELFFESSGTTGQITSKHWVADKSFYLKIARQIFEQAYGSIKDFTVLALLPSYLERANSSLVAMADDFIQLSNDPRSGFYLNEHQALYDTLMAQKAAGKKTLLIGVTFGLLDFAEEHQMDFPELIVMETGGMKGRREELVREEVHTILRKSFGVSHVHSEYGMTELFSQAYAKADGLFECGKTMKVFTRDINDPLTVNNNLRSGVLNIIDLANVQTCSFIETKDVGKVHSDGKFEVLGRMDNSDVRGCNLMVS